MAKNIIGKNLFKRIKILNAFYFKLCQFFARQNTELCFSENGRAFWFCMRFLTHLFVSHLMPQCRLYKSASNKRLFNFSRSVNNLMDIAFVKIPFLLLGHSRILKQQKQPGKLIKICDFFIFNFWHIRILPQKPRQALIEAE